MRLTAGAAFESLREEDGVWTARYRLASGEELLAVWTADGACDARVGGRVSEAWDLMGAPVRCEGALRVTENPVYLRGRALAVAAR